MPGPWSITRTTNSAFLDLGVSGAQIFGDHRDDLASIEGLDGRVGRFLACQLQHVGHEPVQTLALLPDPQHRSIEHPRFAEHAACVQIAVALQRSERCAQFVGHVGQEATHTVAGFGGGHRSEFVAVDRGAEPNEHVVEGCGEVGGLP